MTTADGGREGGAEVIGHDGKPLAVRELYYDRQPDREVRVIASVDGMHAYMQVAPGPAFSGLTRENVLLAIAAAGVAYGVIEQGVRLFVATQNSPAPFAGYYQVARGLPMQKGENGSMEFHVQPTSLAPRYDENSDGTMDFKQLNLIENCFAGQRVASILPPGPGRPGRDVFGAAIPPVPGEPVRVQTGSGVIISANGRELTSEIEGRVVFDDNVLSVSPALEISRDIDYSVGNVDFVGKVIVNGSLLDGFYINAKRGVELRGDMGAARISSEGDVVITGGIKGKNAAIITCRSLSARYIDEASVEASADVTAVKEIMNSDVKALGRVSVAGGAVIGGAVVGYQGVEADTFGSDMGVSTRVLAGLNWSEENRKDEIRAAVAEYQDRVRSAKVLLDPLFADKEAVLRLGGEEKSMLSELVTELRDVRELLAELLDERMALDSHETAGRVEQINARKMVHPGVMVRFRRVDAPVNDAIAGPVSLLPELRTMRTAALKAFPARGDVSELARKAEEATGGTA